MKTVVLIIIAHVRCFVSIYGYNYTNNTACRKVVFFMSSKSISNVSWLYTEYYNAVLPQYSLFRILMKWKNFCIHPWRNCNCLIPYIRFSANKQLIICNYSQYVNKSITKFTVCMVSTVNLRFVWYLRSICGLYGIYGQSTVCMVSTVNLRFVWYLRSIYGLCGIYGQFTVCVVSTVNLRFVWYLRSICGLYGIYGQSTVCMVSTVNLRFVWYLRSIYDLYGSICGKIPILCFWP